MFIGGTKKKSLPFGKDDTDFVRGSHKNDLLHDDDQTNRCFGSFSKDSIYNNVLLVILFCIPLLLLLGTTEG